MWQNKLHVYIHFVWGTRDLPMITSDVEPRLYRYTEGVCKKAEWEVLAVGGMPDHVHLLVKLSSTITLADLIHHIKVGSFKLLSEQTDKPFEWQRGYGAFSVSTRHKESVIAYIRNQKQHHADHTLWPEAEEWQTHAPASAGTQPERSGGSTGGDLSSA